MARQSKRSRSSRRTAQTRALGGGESCLDSPLAYDRPDEPLGDERVAFVVGVDRPGDAALPGEGFGEGDEPGVARGVAVRARTGRDAADDGVIVITTDGDVTGDVGISATNAGVGPVDGIAITIDVAGGSVTGTVDDGIHLTSPGAMVVNVASGASVSTDGTGSILFDAIEVGGLGTLEINNEGTIGSDENGIAIFRTTTGDGATTVNNLEGGELNGQVDLSNAADVVTNDGTWNTAGDTTLNNAFYGGIDLVTNSGTGVINATNAFFDGLETFDNEGELNVNGTLTFTTVATALSNTGTINLDTATVTGIAGPLVNDGTISSNVGANVISVDLTNNDTLVMAGTSTLTVPNYTQDAAGTIVFELSPDADGGTQALGTYPQLLVTGTATLDGSIVADVSPVNGIFADSYRWENVIDAGTLAGAEGVNRYVKPAVLEIKSDCRCRFAAELFLCGNRVMAMQNLDRWLLR